MGKNIKMKITIIALVGALLILAIELKNARTALNTARSELTQQAYEAGLWKGAYREKPSSVREAAEVEPDGAYRANLYCALGAHEAGRDLDFYSKHARPYALRLKAELTGSSVLLSDDELLVYPSYSEWCRTNPFVIGPVREVTSLPTDEHRRLTNWMRIQGFGRSANGWGYSMRPFDPKELDTP